MRKLVESILRFEIRKNPGTFGEIQDVIFSCFFLNDVRPETLPVARMFFITIASIITITIELYRAVYRAL